MTTKYPTIATSNALLLLCALSGCAPSLTRVPASHPARASAEAAPLANVASNLGAEDTTPPPPSSVHHHHHGAAMPEAEHE